MHTLYSKFFILLTFSLLTNNLGASTLASDDYHLTMEQYINLPEPKDLNTNFKLINKEVDHKTGVTKIEYIFNSQVWPKADNGGQQNKWQHRVFVYAPNKPNLNKTAVLWLNGGTKFPNNIKSEQYPEAAKFPAYPIDFAKIANSTSSVVIDLHDIPNQFITLDNKPYAEDALIAHTWTTFIKDPVKYKFYSAYLPMVKSVIKGMDNITNLKEIDVDDFIVSGLSKRGMTTWLSALHDDRVKAIVPVSIDVLNFKKNVTHIFKSHQSWPIALHDYYEQKTLQNLSHKNSKYLMQVNDPYQYITCESCDIETKNKFRQRIENIDKYLILASGDDFFAPDSLSFYYDKIPGKKNIRYIPNSRHMINNKVITDALIGFIYSIENKHKLPTISSEVISNKNSANDYFIKITTNTKPESIKLYSANNKDKRDFRLASNIQYKETILNIDKNNKTTDKKTTSYVYSIPVTKPATGWKASFVELSFEIKHNTATKKAALKDLDKLPKIRLTSPITIMPDVYPKNIASNN